MVDLKAFYTASIGYLSSLLAGFSLDSVGIIVGIVGAIVTTVISYLRYNLELRKLEHSLKPEKNQVNDN